MELPPNPKQAYGDKKPNVALVPPALDLYAALALGDGAVKYGPYNWREKSVEVMTYVAAIMRHLGAWVDRSESSEIEPFVAPDGTQFILGGKPQLAHVAACVAILADAIENGNAIDNRPPKGPSLKIQGDWHGKLPAGKKPEEPEQYGKPAFVQAQEALDAQPCKFPDPIGIPESDGYCLTHFSYACQHKLDATAKEISRRLYGRGPGMDAVDHEGERITAQVRRSTAPRAFAELKPLPEPIGKYEHACPDLDQEYPLCQCRQPLCCSGKNAAPMCIEGKRWSCVRFKQIHEGIDVVV